MGFLSELPNVFKGIVSSISNALKDSPLVRSLVTTLAAALPPPFDVIAVVVVQALAASAGVDEKPDEPEKVTFAHRLDISNGSLDVPLQ